MASNVSMNRKTKTNGNIFALSACMTSICKNVGASEGGIATSDFANSKCVMSIDPVTSYEAEMADGICGTAILPKQVKTVAMAIPHRIEPRTRRACSTAVVNKPMKKTIRSGEAKCAFNFTAVPGSLMITPAWRSPMNAMNSPIPAAIPFFMLGLTELKISSRNPISDSFKKSAPETNTTPSATCQLLAKPAAVAAGIAEKTKKNFHPCPAPERSGNARTEP